MGIKSHTVLRGDFGTDSDIDLLVEFEQDHILGLITLSGMEIELSEILNFETRLSFIIKLKNGDHLILETKGQDSEQNKTKRAFLDEWCKAVTRNGGFGKWHWTVSFDSNDLEKLLHDANDYTK